MSDEYLFAVDPSRVEAWATFRLPFEPTGTRRGFRDALRLRLRNLTADRDVTLHAIYGSVVAAMFDIDNVLLYNVNYSAFSHLPVCDLVIERSWSAPPCIELPGAGHYYAYRLGEPGGSFAHQAPGMELARWETATRQALPRTADSIWELVRTTGTMSTAQALEGSSFGLEIVIQGPARPSLVGLSKALLDGIISAFHVHDGSEIDEACSSLASRVGLTAHALQQLLMDPAVAVLGLRRLRQRNGHSWGWNPADDRCEAAAIRFEPDPDGWSMRGSLFELAESGSGGSLG